MAATTRDYSAGSVIYFEGDKSESIFVLKTGSITLTYTSIDTGEEITEAVKQGEFFGVKSALAHIPREESAQVIKDSQVLLLDVADFEKVASTNTQLLIKLLKVFSNQLRGIHKKLHMVLSSTEMTNPALEFMKMGDYLLKNKRFDQAKYVYSRYKINYPDSPYIDEAAERLELAEKGIAVGIRPLDPSLVGITPSEPAEAPKKGAAKAAPKSEMMEDELDKLYYEAKNLLSSNNYQKAYGIFGDVIGKARDFKRQDLIDKGMIEMSNCLLGMEKHDQVITYSTECIKGNPNIENLNQLLFNISSAHIHLGDKDKASNFLNRIIQTESEDSPIFMKSQKLLKALS